MIKGINLSIHDQFEFFTDGIGFIFYAIDKYNDINANDPIFDVMFDLDSSEWTLYDHWDDKTLNVSATVIIYLFGKEQYEWMLYTINTYKHQALKRFLPEHRTIIDYGQNAEYGFIYIEYENGEWIRATLDISKDLRNNDAITVNSHSITNYNEEYYKGVIYMIASSGLFDRYNNP